MIDQKGLAMAKSSEELVNSLQKFGRNNVKSANNTELAQKWQRQMSEDNLSHKLERTNWQFVKGVLVFGAFSGLVYMSHKLVEKYEEKEYKPKVIDVPESYTDENGEVLDWSKCPEAYQPDENGNYPDEPGNHSSTTVKLISVHKSGEKAAKLEAKKESVATKLAAKAKSSLETKSAAKETKPKETKQDKISLMKRIANIFRGGDSEEKSIMEMLNLNSTQKARVAAWKKRALKNDVAEDVFNHNLKVVMSSKTTAMLSVIYFENFSDEPYLDSAGVPTIGYGLCTYPNGKRVTMRDRAISRTLPAELIAEHGKNKEAMFAKGRQMSEDHLEARVFGSLLSKIKVKLSNEQAVAITSFVYNIGSPLFESSTFLKKLNKEDKNAFVEMTRFNSCAGKWNKGLQVRRGIEYLMATGKLNPDDLLDFRASGGYDPENLGLLFDLKKLRKSPGKMNLPIMSADKIKTFVLSQQRAGLKVKNIMDMKTVQRVSDDRMKLAMLKEGSRGA